MILIKQDTRLDRHKLEVLLNKYGHFNYSFDTNLIRDDIDKVSVWIDESHTALRIENLKKTKAYLEKLEGKANKGILKVDWVLCGNRIVSLPIEIKKIKTYNIQAIDYLKLDGVNVVCIDYTELLNIIAFEISYRDYDITYDYIEEKLYELGLVSIYSSEYINDIVDKQAYEKSMVMRIGSTSYRSPNKHLYTYFGDKLEYSDYYRRIVEESCYTAISIVVTELLSRLNNLGVNVNICGVFEDSVYIALPNGRDKKVEDELSTSVVVRAFGRKFEIKPKIQVY